MRVVAGYDEQPARPGGKVVAGALGDGAVVRARPAVVGCRTVSAGDGGRRDTGLELTRHRTGRCREGTQGERLSERGEERRRVGDQWGGEHVGVQLAVEHHVGDLEHQWRGLVHPAGAYGLVGVRQHAAGGLGELVRELATADADGHQFQSQPRSGERRRVEVERTPCDRLRRGESTTPAERLAQRERLRDVPAEVGVVGRGHRLPPSGQYLVDVDVLLTAPEYALERKCRTCLCEHLLDPGIADGKDHGPGTAQRGPTCCREGVVGGDDDVGVPGDAPEPRVVLREQGGPAGRPCHPHPGADDGVPGDDPAPLPRQATQLHAVTPAGQTHPQPARLCDTPQGEVVPARVVAGRREGDSYRHS